MGIWGTKRRAIESFGHPQGLRQLSRARAQLLGDNGAAPFGHYLNPGGGLKSADKDGVAAVADKVKAPMHAVDAVDIGVPRWAEHGLVARCGTTKTVRRGIVGRVGLSLDNNSANTVDEQGDAKQGRRNDHSWAHEKAWPKCRHWFWSYFCRFCHSFLRPAVEGRMRIILSLIVALALWAPAQAKEVCTLVSDVQTGAIVFERGDCTTPVTPASTFKVPLAVMGFDAGFIKSPKEPVLEFFKGDPDWGANWQENTNPTQWMINSTLWYSQRIARFLGPEVLTRYARTFGYGNADFSGDEGENNGLDRAWVSSSLLISPRDQARFLLDLLKNQLPVSAQAQANARALVQPGGTVNGWAVYGKTGSAYPRRADQSFDYARGWGWYVGWAQKGQETYVVVRLNQETQRRSGSIGVIARDALLADLRLISPFDAP